MSALRRQVQLVSWPEVVELAVQRRESQDALELEPKQQEALAHESLEEQLRQAPFAQEAQRRRSTAKNPRSRR